MGKNKKKKVLCLTDGFSLGGAERQLIGLAYLLKGKGYDVELCSYLKRDFYNQLITSYGLHHDCLNIQGGRFRKLCAVYYKVKKGKYDWVIAYKDGATTIACILKFLGIKFSLIVSERNTNLQRARYDDIKFFLYRNSDYIVPNSFSQENFISRNYPRLIPKVVTINNFTDTDYFRPRLEVEKNGNTERITILISARIAEQKNIIRFLDVVKHLKDSCKPVLFKWFGNVSANEDDYEQACKNKVSELGIDDYIKFYPATNQILKEYQSCDAFCLPSIYEGYPNVICEAMSCEKPVLCSRVCDNPLIVEEGLSGLMFDPYDTEDIYEKLARFISMTDQQRKKMGMNGRKIALEKFSTSKFVSKYIELLEKNDANTSYN